MTKKRGEFSIRLQAKLDTQYKSIIEYASKKDSNLDVQLRGNEIDIYYKGGKILGIVSGNDSFEIDKFYFYKDGITKRKSNVEKDAKAGNSEDIQTIKDLERKRDELLKPLYSSPIDAEKYFNNAKKVMSDWAEKIKQDLKIDYSEKDKQHKISLENKGDNPESEYVVLDIEYAVSETYLYGYKGLSPFHYDENHNPISFNKQKEPILKHTPRFDMISIRKSDGKIVILELKEGLHSLYGKSGMHDHVDSFINTVKRDRNGELEFVQDVKRLLDQKKKMNLINEDVSIKDDSVEFMFVYVYESKDSNRQKAEFNEVESLRKRVLHNINISNYDIIYLQPNSFILK